MVKHNLCRIRRHGLLYRSKGAILYEVVLLIIAFCTCEIVLAKELGSGHTSDGYERQHVAPGEAIHFKPASRTHSEDAGYQGSVQVPAIKGVATHRFFEYASQVAVDLMKLNFKKVIYLQFQRYGSRTPYWLSN